MTSAPTLRSLDERLERRATILSKAARELPNLTPAEREERLALVLDFLRREVGDHMRIDQRRLFPRIAERLGNPLAVAPMNYDHRAIRWWPDEIARTELTDTTELQRLLYGVQALVTVHLSREEDLYVGNLDSGTWPAEF